MSGVGDFRSDAARAHYLDAYHAAMAALPEAARFDVPTGFGTVRVYRFDGPPDATPVLLLPGRGGATPMWRPNLRGLMSGRTVFVVDLLGEAGLSVQTRPIAGAADHATWLDETLVGLGLTSVHLVGASIGGWAAVNYAARLPGRATSLVLLDPVQTFARIPLTTLLASAALLVPGMPDAVRRRVMRWIGGGAEVDDSVPEARLIAAATADFVVRMPPPTLISDDRLRSLEIPVLAVLAGRSVMLDPERAAARARNMLSHGHVELWDDASHAINGECPERIAERTRRFWGGG